MNSLIKGPMQLTDDLGIVPGSSYLIPTGNDSYCTLQYNHPLSALVLQNYYIS